MEYLTVRQVAERMKVSVKTVYRLIACAALAAKRIRGCVRVEERELNSFLAQANAQSQRESIKKAYTRGPKYRDRGYRYLEGRGGRPRERA